MYKVKVVIVILLFVDIVLSIICLNMFKDKVSSSSVKKSVF